MTTATDGGSNNGKRDDDDGDYVQHGLAVAFLSGHVDPVSRQSACPYSSKF